MNEMTRIGTVETWDGRVEDDALLRGTGSFGDDVFIAAGAWWP